MLAGIVIAEYHFAHAQGIEKSFHEEILIKIKSPFKINTKIIKI